MPQHDDGHDDLAAMRFFDTGQSGSGDDSGGEAQALSFSVGSDDSTEESTVESLRGWAPAAQSEGAASELEAIRSPVDVAADDDGLDLLSNVTNPPGTVSVTASLDGSIVQIDLSPSVTGMTESALAKEILVIADLAWQKGLARQRTFVGDLMGGLGPAMSEAGLEGDAEGANELLDKSLDLPTEQQAEAAQFAAFANRYAD